MHSKAPPCRGIQVPLLRQGRVSQAVGVGVEGPIVVVVVVWDAETGACCMNTKINIT